jgi:endonuclease G, mitochondrial
MKRRSIYLLAATLAATITLTFLAGCSSGKREGASERLVAVKVTSPHLPFGNPSDAGRAANNQLVLRQQFAASWNASKQIPNWVAWKLVASDIGDTERSQFDSATNVGLAF